MAIRALRSFSALLLSFSILGAAGCTASTDDAETGDEADLTEGSAEAKAVLALVNDTTVSADDLHANASVVTSTATSIVAHRDKTPFATLKELGAVPGVGPATIKNLLAYAKKKGLLGGGTRGTDVIFSPAPADASHLVRIAKEIDQAKTTVDIAIYSYSSSAISDALARAVTRGVKVRFMYDEGGTDSRAATPANTTSGRLEANGVDVRFINPIMHHKFMIVDGPRDDLSLAKTAHLVTGSANWDTSAARTFDENTVIFSGQQEQLVLRYQREFDTMWAHSRDFTSGQDHPLVLSTTTITDAVIPSAADTNAIFTSFNFAAKNTTFSNTGTNTVADGLVEGINAAKTSIHIASGHMRQRLVSDALIAKKKANPAMDIRVYLDAQEYIAKGTNDIQVQKVNTCLTAAGTDAKKKEACLDNDFLFGFTLAAAGIDVRYKYYAYRWDYTYAPQMHHKFLAIDGATLYSGSYNLSDNAEHGTFENMLVLSGASHAALIASFEGEFESIWKTNRDAGLLASLNTTIDAGGDVPIVFDPMALTGDEVTALKDKIRTACPAVDSLEYRKSPSSHRVCKR